MARYRYRRGRFKRAVVRLPDTVTTGPAGTPTAARAWHVVIMTDAERRRLYTVMTQDVAFAVHRATTPVVDGYAQAHAIARLVLVETYHCRHTAYARTMRIRGWPVAERRRLVEAANPDWADLSASEADGAPDVTQPTALDATSAAA